MRVTQSMVIRNTLQLIQLKRERLGTLNEQMATGKEVRSASDDPVKFSRMARFRDALSRNDRYIRNVEDARAWVDNTVSSVEQMQDLITDAWETGKKAVDGSTSPDMRISLADKIDGIIDEIMTHANSHYLGKNVFGGTDTSATPAFTYDGATVTYNGNGDSISRRISDNLTMNVNLPGSDLMNSGVFQNLISLRDALNNDDVTGATALLDPLKEIADSFLAMTTEMASVQNNLELALVRIEDSNLRLTDYISTDEDADLAEVITRYEAEETAYRAAMESGVRIMNLNILEYL
jgi:flagellar hook-associated protein 3 FlgL